MVRHDGGMQRDWARLGAALRAARETRGLGQAEVGEQIGVGRGAMRNIERGEIAKVSTTIRAYARAVGWEDGSIEAVLDGGDPIVAPADSGRDAEAVQSITVAAPEELPLRIRAALASGPLIDAAVIPLPGDDDDDPDANMVVILKGGKRATPEQLRRALERWEEMETRLRQKDG